MILTALVSLNLSAAAIQQKDANTEAVQPIALPQGHGFLTPFDSTMGLCCSFW